MRTSIFALALSGATLFAGPVFADEVGYSLKASMPTLKDNGAKDTFVVTVEDSAVTTTIGLSCTAGKKGFLGVGRADESCDVKGDGKVGGKPGARYAGKFTILSKENGATPLDGIKALYLSTLGANKPENTTWGGSFGMTPENPSANVQTFLARLQAEADAAIAAGTLRVVGQNTQQNPFDVVQFDGVQTPPTGAAGDVGCTWNGSAVYSYATENWNFDLVVECGSDSHALAGDMVWVDGDNGAAQYVLSLDVDGGAGSVEATLDLVQSNFVHVKVGGEEDDLAMDVDAKGKIVGTGVSQDLLRSFAGNLGLLSRTFFGS